MIEKTLLNDKSIIVVVKRLIFMVIYFLHTENGDCYIYAKQLLFELCLAAGEQKQTGPMSITFYQLRMKADLLNR